MTGQQAGKIRARVADLLADADHQHSDFTRHPWRLWHQDGRPFTPQETKLATSATVAELRAAQDLAAAIFGRRLRDMTTLRQARERYEHDPGEPAEAILAPACRSLSGPQSSRCSPVFLTRMPPASLLPSRGSIHPKETHEPPRHPAPSPVCAGVP